MFSRSSSATPANFNPRTSCEVRLKDGKKSLFGYQTSIHAPHAGCDRWYSCRIFPHPNFNPRTSYEVRQYIIHMLVCVAPFQSTHLMRGATYIIQMFVCTCPFQSTHLMRGATRRFEPYGKGCEISIHAPHARCDQEVKTMKKSKHLFQPTHLMRGATSVALGIEPQHVEFHSTHLIRGATSNTS